jgi:hypothetical protein
MPRRYQWLIAALGLMLFAGCATTSTHRAQIIASTETGCYSMRLVEKLAEHRFKLQGCGRTFIYACNVPQFEAARDSLADALASEQKTCRAVSMQIDPPVTKTGAR